MNVFFLFRVAPLGAAAKVTLFSSPASLFGKKFLFFFAGGLTVFADGKDMTLFRFTQAFLKNFFP
jgi:hypothetical protein